MPDFSPAGRGGRVSLEAIQRLGELAALMQKTRNPLPAPARAPGWDWDVFRSPLDVRNGNIWKTALLALGAAGMAHNPGQGLAGLAHGLGAYAVTFDQREQQRVARETTALRLAEEERHRQAQEGYWTAQARTAAERVDTAASGADLATYRALFRDSPTAAAAFWTARGLAGAPPALGAGEASGATLNAARTEALEGSAAAKRVNAVVNAVLATGDAGLLAGAPGLPYVPKAEAGRLGYYAARMRKASEEAAGLAYHNRVLNGRRKGR